MWLDAYPHVSTAALTIQHLVNRLRFDNNLELEARFGSKEGQGFKAGITRTEMDNIISVLTTSPHILELSDWRENHDFFFDANGNTYRTRVRFDDNKMQMTAETIRKCTEASHDFLCVSDVCSDRGRQQVLNAIRVSVKSEAPICDVPSAANANYVRIKQTKRFSSSAQISHIFCINLYLLKMFCLIVG